MKVDKPLSVPPFPCITQLPQWETALMRNLIAASSHADNIEIAWLAEAKAKTFEELGDSSGALWTAARFHHLDSNMATAIIRTLSKETQLRTRVQREENKLVKLNRIIKGRQVVWMIYDWFKTKPHMQSHHSYNDLHSLTWKGDSTQQMEDFMTQWDWLVSKMGPYTDFFNEWVLRDLLHAKMLNTKCQSLVVDLQHFKRAKAKGESFTSPGVLTPTDPDFSLAFLRNIIEIYIHDNREDANLADIRRGHAGHPTAALDAMPGQPATPKKQPKKPKAKASAASPGGGSGSGDFATPQGGSPTKPKMYCYFWNKGARDKGVTKCTRRSPCNFLHEMASEALWAKMQENPPVKKVSAAASDSGSRRGSASGGGSSRSSSLGSRKSDSRGRGDKRKGKDDVKHCFSFLKGGTCSKEGCTFAHMTKEQLTKARQEQKKAPGGGGNGRSGSAGSQRSNKSNKSNRSRGSQR